MWRETGEIGQKTNQILETIEIYCTGYCGNTGCLESISLFEIVFYSLIGTDNVLSFVTILEHV